MQALATPLAAQLYEQMTRFHVLAAAQLADDFQSVANPEGFNAHLNEEQLHKCFSALADIYGQLSRAGQPSECEPELRVLYLLLNLDVHGKYRPDRRAVETYVRGLPPSVLRSPEFRFYQRAERAYSDCRWVTFFKCARAASYLQAALLSLFFPAARRACLRLLAAGVYKELLPLPPLARQLGLSTAALSALAQHHGFSVALRPEDSQPCLSLREGGVSFVLPAAEVEAGKEAIVQALQPDNLCDAVLGPSSHLLAALAARREKEAQAAAEARAAREAQAAAARAAQERAAALAAAQRAGVLAAQQEATRAGAD
jgi:hypothetical protein